MSEQALSARDQQWPALPLKEWIDTYHTLHMWSQMVGKVRLELSPLINHWWEVALYVTARGLTTSPIPYQGEVFEIDFDFIDHKLVTKTSRGEVRYMLLEPRSVADFYHEFVQMLHGLGIDVKINTRPVEVFAPVPFEKDTTHGSYDPEYAHRFWRILVSASTVMTEFRARFIGKDSPVHFFWGSFDLAVTRFSGRPAPQRPGADRVTREAYSHEVSSLGFWPGGKDFRGIEVPDAAFYSYAFPEPAGFGGSPVGPKQAFYDTRLGEFLLMYEDVRNAPSPKDALLEFAQSTYEGAANLAGWDRQALERHGMP